MNVERMLQVADAIENQTLPGVEFDMRDFGRFTEPGVRRDGSVSTAKSCGTACCIGGHAVLMFGQPDDFVGEEAAMKLLGLDGDQVNRLFYNGDHYVGECDSWGEITREQGVAAIRRMVAEG